MGRSDRLVLALAGALTAFAGRSEADPPTRVALGLDEALSRAERAFPGLEAAQHRIAAAEAQLDEAWVAPFASFSVTGFASVSPNARGNPTYSPDSFGQSPLAQGYGPIVRANVETGVPISPWTWIRIGRARDAARQGVRAAEEERSRALLDLRANVRRAWYGALFARDSLYLLDRANGYVDEAAAQQQRQRATGGSSQQDEFRLRAVRSELRARRAQAAAGERRAMAVLGALTGIGSAVDVPDTPLCAVRVRETTLADQLTAARVHRPEVAMVAAGVEARRAALSIQRGSILPDLALGLTAAMASSSVVADQANPFAANNNNFAYWGAGLVLRWNFDPLAWRHRVRRLSEELAMTEAQQRMALGGIAVEVEDAWAGVEEARGRVEAWTDSEDANYSLFMTSFQEYQAGSGDIGDVVDPLRQYLTARFSHLQALHDLNSAWARLAQVTGVDATAGVVESCAQTAPAEDPEVDPAELQRLLGGGAVNPSPAGSVP